MRRTALIILGAAAGLVALVLIGVAIAVATIDPNRFVAPLAARVKTETGRTLAVQGPVDFKVSLQPKVVLPGVTLRECAVVEDARDADRQAHRGADRAAAIAVPAVRSHPVHAGRAGDHARDRCKRSRQLGVRFDNRAEDGSNPFHGCVDTRDRHRQFRDPAGHADVSATARPASSTNASIERMAMHARDMSAPVAVDFRGKIDEVPVR